MQNSKTHSLQIMRLDFFDFVCIIFRVKNNILFFNHLIFFIFILTSCSGSGGRSSGGVSGGDGSATTPAVHVENQSVQEVGSDKYQGFVLFNVGASVSTVQESDEYIMVDPTISHINH